MHGLREVGLGVLVAKADLSFEGWWRRWQNLLSDRLKHHNNNGCHQRCEKENRGYKVTEGSTNGWTHDILSNELTLGPKSYQEPHPASRRLFLVSNMPFQQSPRAL